LDEIWYADRELDADVDGNVKVEPEIEFQCGGRLFSQNLSRGLSCLGEIWYANTCSFGRS